MTWLPYQERVFQERADLREKLDKLLAFLATENARLLPEDEQRRLMRQASIMHDYVMVLTERIFNFPRIKEVA